MPNLGIGFLSGTVERVYFLARGESIQVLILGTWVGTLAAEGSSDPLFSTAPDTARWEALTLITDADGSRLQTTGGNGHFTIVNPGFEYIRLKFTAYTSGTAEISAQTVASTYDIPENYRILIRDTIIVSADGADNIDFTNFRAKGVAFFVLVSGLTGTIPRPQIRLGTVLNAAFYPTVDFTKAGNVVNPDVISLLVYPGASGGLWDRVEPFPVGRARRLVLDWSGIGGGESVTYSVAAEFFL
jgi:hypothetical protein